VGLTHAQHQLLLAVRGSRSEGGPTIGEVAQALGVRHHSATELADRCQALGLLARERDREDARRVRLRLTEHGTEVLNRLTEVHLAELRGLAAALAPVAPGSGRR
jgi:DNA-binding MarR family transcriptional regulator